MADLKTILFTDIMRSVDLKNEMPGRSGTERDQAFIDQILTPHRQRIERELAELGGRVVSTAGDGHFLVFSNTISAARWAIGLQRSHRDEPIRTPKESTVWVRISIHLGIPQVDPHDPNNFIGKPVDYASRLNDYATGGQILVSRSVMTVLVDAGMDDVTFHHHGQRDLKGIGRVEIYELVYDLEAGPRQMRPQPRENVEREWTVLPATMGLTEFGARRGGAKPQAAEGRPTTDVVPWRLGNYELEERLGTGGMGDVYRAKHVQFGRVRAVKVIKQHFVDTGHDEVIRRFYQEIKAVGALEHPNIVVAIDSSAPTDAVHYLVMEFIEGIGADELVARQGPLPIADACEIARQAARGLAYIQQHGMVHRDIKPSNLMLALLHTEPVAGLSEAGYKPGEQAVVKILDLGLALLVGDDQQRLTVFDNRAMGTAMYMSPEQWKTTSVDIRADIYSLGCTLYHLLAGKPPFWESDLKPEKAHEREKLPPMRMEQPLPRELWEILLRMTAKNPAERFAEPAEVAAALAPFAAGHHLPELVRKARGLKAQPETDGFAKADTLMAKSAESDTLARAPGSWSVARQLVLRRRQWFMRAAMGVATLAAVAVIGWLAWQATATRQSMQKAQQARQDALQVAALAANREILKEINRRFEILQQLAGESELQQQMVQIKSTPTDETLWKRLEDWLGARKADHDREVSADSWFIDDVRGVQVARSPRSDSTRGDTFAHRDYFHGQGTDLPAGTKNLKPIDTPHLSAVYRSTSSQKLKVAFSVPIQNGKKGKQRETVGVLAMSVDLGEFDVLKEELPHGHEVVLIDLREATIDLVTRRGLILHHQKAASYGKDQPPPWISAELLSRIDEALKTLDTSAPESGAMLSNYRDAALTGGNLYWGALKPVVDRHADEPARDYRWLVIVQEAVLR
jgi:serine/threonine protein kinase/class 3 adenylate cyclase/type II secretory pathway pseudopilin PulG